MKIYLITELCAHIGHDNVHHFVDNLTDDEIEKIDDMEEFLEDHIDEVMNNMRPMTPNVFRGDGSYETDQVIEGDVARFKVCWETDWNEHLYEELQCYETSKAMGSLTIEYGHLPAVSFSYWDYYTNDMVNVYLSPLPELPDNLTKQQMSNYWETLESFLMELDDLTEYQPLPTLSL